MANIIPSFFSDMLQSYPFWLFDVAPIDQIGLPLFFPLFGFSRITSPEVTATIRTVKEGNWHYARKVVSGATVSPITMERGVYWADSDFYRFIQATIHGNTGLFGVSGLTSLGDIPGPTPRRNLLLVHFFSRGPFNDNTLNAVAGANGLIGLGVLGSGLSNNLNLTSAAQLSTQLTGSSVFFELSNQAVRIPAKAWLLVGCIPTRYKAASDFDSQSAAVSVQELDIEYERFEEISLSA